MPDHFDWPQLFFIFLYAFLDIVDFFLGLDVPLFFLALILLTREFLTPNLFFVPVFFFGEDFFAADARFLVVGDLFPAAEEFFLAGERFLAVDDFFTALEDLFALRPIFFPDVMIVDC